MGQGPRLLLLLCLLDAPSAVSSTPCESSLHVYQASTAMKGLLFSKGALVNLTTSSRPDCTMACSRHPNCTAVNWAPGHGTNCRLIGCTLETPRGREQSWPSAEYLYRVKGSQPAESTCTSTGASCQSLYQAGHTTSGVYTISLGDGGADFDAFCEMDTDGGGWTVFLNRESADVDFDRTWSECEVGFGYLSGNHWLGLTQIRRLTEAGLTSLRVDVSDWAGVWKYAKYSTFRLGTPQDRYRLTITGFSGDIDAKGLDYHHNGLFATRDNDYRNCAKNRGGPWWYRSCGWVQPMSPYGQNGSCTTSHKCMIWYHWHGWSTSMKSFRFMLK